MIGRIALFALFLGALAQGAHGAGVKNVAVSGNTLTAELDLLGVDGEITIEFEEVGNLTPTSVGLSATLISPINPLVLNRLPSGGLVSIPTAFPVRLTFNPPPSGELWYRGPVEIRIHTESLNYILGTPLRLYAASPGGNFQDATESIGAGSYRVGAYSPRFAGDYAIVVDLRVIDEVVWSKLDYVEGVLAANAGGMSPQLTTTLQVMLADVRTAVAEDRIVDARDLTDDFLAAVTEASGTEIPDLWEADGELVNSAGALISAGSTLAFSLLGLEQGPL